MRSTHILKAILICVLCVWTLPLFAQESPADGPKEVKEYVPNAGSKKAAEVKAIDPKDRKRGISAKKTLKGPRLKRDSGIDESGNKADIERLHRVIDKLKLLIAGTPDDAENKADLLNRLSQEILKLSKIYDDTAYEDLDKAVAARADGNEAEATRLERSVEDLKAKALKQRREANLIYLEIIENHPLYEGMDKVLFFFAHNLTEMGEGADAQKLYKQIMLDHPDSAFAPAALVSMGDFHFADDDVEGALELYQQVVDGYMGDANAGYAMYKIGWCYFNLGEPRKALKQFQAVIAYSDEMNSPSLKKEATRDLVKAYSLWDQGDPRKARKYFSSFAEDRPMLDKMMEQLAGQYLEQGKIKHGIYVFDELIKFNKNSFKIVHYQTEIMFAVEAFSEPNKTVKAIKSTVRLYTKAKNGKNFTDKTPEALKQAYTSLEEYTRETAKWYHKVALTTKNPLYLALAYELYKIYIDNFEEAEDNYEMIFFYAEFLYAKAKGTGKDIEDQMRLYAEAGKRYDQAIDINAKGEYSKEAAHGAVLAYDKLTRQVSDACPEIPNESQSIKITKVPDPENPKKTIKVKTFPVIEMPQCRVRALTAIERYVKVVEKSKNLPDIKYHAAKMYYDYNNFSDAIPRFIDMIENHPEHELSVYAANLLLDSFNIGKDTKNMYLWVGKMRANKVLLQTDVEYQKGELEGNLAGLAEGLAFEFCLDEEKAKNWEVAANCYEKFVEDFPTAKDADKALWNAGIAWEGASDIGRAIQIRTFLLTDYPESDLAPRTLHRIAANWHGIATYSMAAETYEAFVANFPDHPDAKDALSNAAAFRDGLGQVEEAIADYDMFIAKFPKDSRIELLEFNTGQIYFRNKHYKKAIDRFEKYRIKYRKPGKGDAVRKLGVNLMIAKSHWEQRQFKTADKYLQKVTDGIKNKGFQKFLRKNADAQTMSRVNAIAAEARFLEAERVYKQALAVQLFEGGKADDKKLQKQLGKKSKLIQDAAKIYGDVQVYKSTNWTLAALCRIGMMQHDVAEQVLRAPIPESIKKDEDTFLFYEEILEEAAFNIEDSAVKNYVTALKTAATLGWFNQYTNEARERLFSLRPQEYSSASEIMSQPDQSLVRWHKAEFFSDIEAASGNKEKKKVRSMEIKKEAKPATATPAAAAAAPAASAEK